VQLNLIHSILVFWGKKYCSYHNEVNLIHFKLVFFKKILKKLIHWKKKCSREQCKWIVLFMWTVTVKKSNTGKKLKKWTLKKKTVHMNNASELHYSREQCIHLWTQCVLQVVTRQKAVFYCFQQIMILPHINGRTSVFWLFNIL